VVLEQGGSLPPRPAETTLRTGFPAVEPCSRRGGAKHKCAAAPGSANGRRRQLHAKASILPAVPAPTFSGLSETASLSTEEYCDHLRSTSRHAGFSFHEVVLPDERRVSVNGLGFRHPDWRSAGKRPSGSTGSCWSARGRVRAVLSPAVSGETAYIARRLTHEVAWSLFRIGSQAVCPSPLRAFAAYKPVEQGMIV
jgi:hypothetical protein